MPDGRDLILDLGFLLMKAPLEPLCQACVDRNTGFHDASVWLVMVVGIMKVT